MLLVGVGGSAGGGGTNGGDNDGAACGGAVGGAVGMHAPLSEALYAGAKGSACGCLAEPGTSFRVSCLDLVGEIWS